MGGERGRNTVRKTARAYSRAAAQLAVRDYRAARLRRRLEQQLVLPMQLAATLGRGDELRRRAPGVSDSTRVGASLQQQLRCARRPRLLRPALL